MADINLLGGSNQKHNFGRTGISLIVKALVLVLILVGAYYVYLRVQISRTRSSIQDTQTKTSQLQADVLKGKDRAEALTRQGQLQNANALIKNHVYWSALIPELARVTLRSASYAGFVADTTGTISLDVVVPNYAEADKYIQVFDLPQFNQQFSDLKILSMSKSQQGSTVQTLMKLQLKFSPEFIRKTVQ